MTTLFLIASGALLLATTHAAAQVEPSPSEAVKLLHADRNKSNITPMVWNGERVIFVDLPVENDAMAERHAYIVRKVDSKLRALKVMVAEEEGGKPEVAAIGLANADHDTAKELVVLLKWEQVHYDYGGRFWEVRLFDDITPDQTELRLLPQLSAHFGLGCECSWRNGEGQTYRFKTLAAVRKELNRLGY